VTHILAAVGKPRPYFQRARLPNTLLTLGDAATYAAMYRMMKSTGATRVLAGIPVLGAVAHVGYVISQLDDGWYREYADDYGHPTLVNGKLLHYKMAASAVDAAFYTIGLVHLLTRVPLSKTALPVAAGAIAGLIAWRPWKEEPASHEAVP
jgi:hypothetical protein